MASCISQHILKLELFKHILIKISTFNQHPAKLLDWIFAISTRKRSPNLSESKVSCPHHFSEDPTDVHLNFVLDPETYLDSIRGLKTKYPFVFRFSATLVLVGYVWFCHQHIVPLSVFLLCTAFSPKNIIWKGGQRFKFDLSDYPSFFQEGFVDLTLSPFLGQKNLKFCFFSFFLSFLQWVSKLLTSTVQRNN